MITWAGHRFLALLGGLLALLPPRWMGPLARFITWIWLWILPVRREVARANLHQCIPPLPGGILSEVGYSQALHGLMLLTEPHLRRRGLCRPVLWRGRSHLDDLLAQGRGVVVVTAHLGPWELLGGICRDAGYPLTVVVRRPRSVLAQVFIERLRQENHLTLLYDSDPVIWKALGTLRQGGIVALLVDQHFPGGYLTPFLGRDCLTTPLPALLSSRARCGVIPAYCLFRENHIEVVVEKGFFPPSPAQLHTFTCDLTHRAETWIRREPGQWLWLHRRWKGTPDLSPKRRLVVHVDTGDGWRGGQRQVFLLLREQVRAGFTVLLICQLDSPLAVRCQSEGIPVFPVRMRSELDPRALMQLTRLFQHLDISLLHTHDARAHGLMVLTRLFLRRRDIPLVVHRRVTTPLRRGPWARFKYTQADRIIAISAGVAESLQRRGVPPGKIRRVSSVVDVPTPGCTPGQIRQHFHIPEDSLLLVAVGALVNQKGHRVLVDALPRVLAQFPTVRLVVAGEGPLRGRLQRQIEQLGLDSVVTLVGEVENPADLIACCDLFVHPSLEEGLGTVLLEAALLKRPVVASSTGGIPEALQGYESAVLVPPGDVEALALALCRCLSTPSSQPATPDPGPWTRSPVAMMVATRAVYDELLREKDATPTITHR